MTANCRFTLQLALWDTYKQLDENGNGLLLTPCVVEFRITCAVCLSLLRAASAKIARLRASNIARFTAYLISQDVRYHFSVATPSSPSFRLVSLLLAGVLAFVTLSISQSCSGSHVSRTQATRLRASQRAGAPAYVCVYVPVFELA